MIYEKSERIARITLNRPDALNALRLEAINGYSSVGDFSDARQRLAKFFAKDNRAAPAG